MTHHLSPQEFVESLDGVLATSRLDHLHACAECRADLDRLRSVVTEVQAAEMPEPSPLFWNHFSERVRQATAAAPTPVAASWWSAAWRPVAGFAAGLAVVILPVLLWPRSGPVGAGAGGGDASRAVSRGVRPSRPRSTTRRGICS